MNVRDLKEKLERRPDDTPVCATLWWPEEIEDFVNGDLPENEPITGDEVKETLLRMYYQQDCKNGINWEFIRECLPDSVKNRLK